MKRRIILFCLAALLCVAAVVAYKYRASIFRSGDVSELYRAYKDTPSVDATFIRDFQVDDTVSVDVTLLQATDSAGWERLLSNVRTTNELEEYFKLLKNKKTVSLQSFPKGHLGLAPDTVFLNNDILAIDWAKQTLAIFHITEKKQSKAIISYHLDVVKPNKKQS